MTQDEFIEDVRDEVTISCSLPFTVPIEEFPRIIKWAAKWFYKRYEDSVEERYYRIKRSSFINDENFKKYRTVTLPECVFSVNWLTQVDAGFSSSTPFSNMADFTLEKVLFKNISNLANSTESLLEYVAYESFVDLTRHILAHPISYNYNRNSRDLVILGETPSKDMVLQIYAKLPIEDLMEDEVFYRYVVAKVKTQLSRILGTFDFKLPGSVTINFDAYREEGERELEKIEEEIKADEGADWFLTTGGK